MSLMNGAALAASLTVAVLAAASPAVAHDQGHGWKHRHYQHWYPEISPEPVYLYRAPPIVYERPLIYREPAFYGYPPPPPSLNINIPLR